MGFIPISIDEYIKKHLKSNPSESETDLRKRLNRALTDYKNGLKCHCGNDIWVIGSASVATVVFLVLQEKAIQLMITRLIVQLLNQKVKKDKDILTIFNQIKFLVFLTMMVMR